jgi:protein-S-isoprenylcysteine O-methyltransferase Ste14
MNSDGMDPSDHANRDETTESPKERGRMTRIRTALVNAISYIMPLLMSSPGLYAGIMTMPFLFYLLLMVTSFQGVLYLFLGGSILENTILILGLIFFLCSIVFLWCTKSEGLVTIGPYRIVRHPQYLSLILFTAVLTSRSVWVLLNTFGIGFLRPYETIVVWFVMSLIYIGLAILEECHIRGVYHEEWVDYRRHVGFLFPLTTSERRWLEVLVSVIFLVALMEILLFSNGTAWWFVQ